MTSALALHADALLLGTAVGAVYYVVARAMEVLALQRSPQASVSLVLAGLGMRFVVAGFVLWVLIAATGWHAGALCVGFLTAYTVILFGESVRVLRADAGGRSGKGVGA